MIEHFRVVFLSGLFLLLSLSCAPAQLEPSRSTGHPQAAAVPDHRDRAVQFEDRSGELVGHAETLIAKNEAEGAVLDQRWYAFRRFGQHQSLILGATQVVFFGGLEDHVRRHSGDRYTSMTPLEQDGDTGEIRLFIGARNAAQYDFIIIGQNGREVALKTVIRLLYLARFVDDETRRRYGDRLAAFSQSIKVLMSSLSARLEFIEFFNRHGLSRPDAVLIGFMGDSRALLKKDGVADPQVFADESLRVNWYADANGKRVLLVSIDGNRIYASRAGELIRALFHIADTPLALVFLGSAGAIEEPSIVGKIVLPAVVLNADPFPVIRQHRGVLAHIIRNRAMDKGGIRTAHASVENVVVETTEWARRMIADRIKTVDQELFHIVEAVNSSADPHRVDFFAGVLVTDNVSTRAEENTDVTLEHAEEMIAKTAGARREFLSAVLGRIGVLADERRGERKRAAS